jgi:hypothetical protein
MSDNAEVADSISTLAIQQGCSMYDEYLYGAIRGAQPAIIDFLVAHGLPRRDLLLETSHEDEPFGIDQLRCLQRLIDKGCRINSGTLISAAIYGDVGLVRFLHSRGVPLWARAAEELDWDEGPYPYLGGGRDLVSNGRSARRDNPHPTAANGCRAQVGSLAVWVGYGCSADPCHGGSLHVEACRNTCNPGLLPPGVLAEPGEAGREAAES